jgi:hypothetical protein
MSLINEALKRAKQAHQENSPPRAPVPALRPVEAPQQTAGKSFGLMLPIGLGLLAVIGLMVFFLMWNRQNPTQASDAGLTVVAAKTISPDANETSKTAAPIRAGTAVRPGGDHPEATVISSEHPATLLTGPTPAANQAPAPVIAADSNHLAAEVAPAPAPPPLKLQSIVFSPRNPSALINGRVVFIGDRVRDLRVTAIHRGDVVLTGVGRTNLLSLEP